MHYGNEMFSLSLSCSISDLHYQIVFRKMFDTEIYEAGADKVIFVITISNYHQRKSIR